MVGKYKIITLCGSTKFKDQFLAAGKKLTLDGNIVISKAIFVYKNALVGMFGHSDNEVWNEDVMEMLDDMHKRKIDMKAIFVFCIQKCAENR